MGAPKGVLIFFLGGGPIFLVGILLLGLQFTPPRHTPPHHHLATRAGPGYINTEGENGNVEEAAEAEGGAILRQMLVFRNR